MIQGLLKVNIIPFISKNFIKTVIIPKFSGNNPDNT